MNSYLTRSESLWRDWLDGRVRPLVPRLARLFDLEAMPEPWLDFDAGARPLVVLTTNPGGTMDHQLRSAIVRGDGPIREQMSYAEAAKALAAYYQQVLAGTSAGRRIRALLEVAREAGYDGVLQAECIPWHSADLPNKARLLGLLRGEPTLTAYLRDLRAFLDPRPVLAVSAVSSRLDLTDREAPLSPWLQWQAKLLGIDPRRAERHPLVKKGARVTGTALIDPSFSEPKALVLMMGSNNLPGAEGKRRLVEALRAGAS